MVTGGPGQKPDRKKMTGLSDSDMVAGRLMPKQKQLHVKVCECWPKCVQMDGDECWKTIMVDKS